MRFKLPTFPTRDRKRSGEGQCSGAGSCPLSHGKDVLGSAGTAESSKVCEDPCRVRDISVAVIYGIHCSRESWGTSLNH